MPRKLPLAAVLLVTAAAGCTDTSVAQVSGVVTMNGKPLSGARVQFSPSGPNPAPGSGSYAITGPDGRYQLRQIDPDRDGAVVGPHVVRVSTVFASQEDVGLPPKDPIPERYNATTKLVFDVPASGAAEANFDLTAP